MHFALALTALFALFLLGLGLFVFGWAAYRMLESGDDFEDALLVVLDRIRRRLGDFPDDDESG